VDETSKSHEPGHFDALRQSEPHGLAQCVVSPPVVHGLVQASVQIVNLEAVRMTHCTSLSQLHAFHLRSDSGFTFTFAETQQQYGVGVFLKVRYFLFFIAQLPRC
jgi:hypothetical protein